MRQVQASYGSMISLCRKLLVRSYSALNCLCIFRGQALCGLLIRNKGVCDGMVCDFLHRSQGQVVEKIEILMCNCVKSFCIGHQKSWVCFPMLHFLDQLICHAAHCHSYESGSWCVPDKILQVLDANPAHVKALYRRGMAYLEVGDFEEARSDFEMVTLIVIIVVAEL